MRNTVRDEFTRSNFELWRCHLAESAIRSIEAILHVKSASMLPALAERVEMLMAHPQDPRQKLIRVVGFSAADAREGAFGVRLRRKASNPFF